MVRILIRIELETLRFRLTKTASTHQKCCSKMYPIYSTIKKNVREGCLSCGRPPTHKPYDRECVRCAYLYKETWVAHTKIGYRRGALSSAVTIAQGNAEIEHAHLYTSIPCCENTKPLPTPI